MRGKFVLMTILLAAAFAVLPVMAYEAGSPEPFGPGATALCVADSMVEVEVALLGAEIPQAPSTCDTLASVQSLLDVSVNAVADSVYVGDQVFDMSGSVVRRDDRELARGANIGFSVVVNCVAILGDSVTTDGGTEYHLLL